MRSCPEKELVPRAEEESTLKKEITHIKYISLTVKECDFIYR